MYITQHMLAVCRIKRPRDKSCLNGVTPQRVVGCNNIVNYIVVFDWVLYRHSWYVTFTLWSAVLNADVVFVWNNKFKLRFYQLKGIIIRIQTNSNAQKTLPCCFTWMGSWLLWSSRLQIRDTWWPSELHGTPCQKNKPKVIAQCLCISSLSSGTHYWFNWLC